MQSFCFFILIVKCWMTTKKEKKQLSLKKYLRCHGNKSVSFIEIICWFYPGNVKSLLFDWFNAFLFKYVVAHENSIHVI